jgi:hypothetical protein
MSRGALCLLKLLSAFPVSATELLMLLSAFPVSTTMLTGAGSNLGTNELHFDDKL